MPRFPTGAPSHWPLGSLVASRNLSVYCKPWERHTLIDVNRSANKPFQQPRRKGWEEWGALQGEPAGSPQRVEVTRGALTLLIWSLRRQMTFRWPLTTWMLK